MKKYFYVKRTKMVDEAVQNHRYVSIFKSILFFMLVYYISSLAVVILEMIPLTAIFMSTPEFSSLINADDQTAAIATFLESFEYPSWFAAVDLICRIAIILIVILYCKFFEKRRITSLGIRKSNAVCEYLIGLLIGFALFAITVFFAWATNSIEIAINPDGVSSIIILYLIGFIIQGASEELLVRGYFMISLARDYKVLTSIIVSSLVFSVIHLFNSGMNIIAFINIFLVGVVFAVYVFKRGNIWGACAIHTMWNFAQGNIFGVSVSGMDLMPSVFVVTQNNADHMWLLHGGEFGLEGSLICTLVMLIALAIVFALPTKKTEISATEEGYIPTQRKNKKLWEPF